MGLTAAAYARMLIALLPAGRLWRIVGGGLLVRLLEGCALELERLDGRARALLEEADASTAVELLPEYESALGLPSTGSVDERQARVVARLIARQRYRPIDFRAALAPVLGLSPSQVTVIERSRADAIAMDDDGEIFRFFVYRNPSLPGAYYLGSAQAIVDKIKPSHTAGHVIESIDFRCDDPYSLCDRDILESGVVVPLVLSATTAATPNPAGVGGSTLTVDIAVQGNHSNLYFNLLVECPGMSPIPTLAEVDSDGWSCIVYPPVGPNYTYAIVGQLASATHGSTYTLTFAIGGSSQAAVVDIYPDDFFSDQADGHSNWPSYQLSYVASGPVLYTLTKSGGVDGTYDAQAYTSETFAGTISVEFEIVSVGSVAFCVGLSGDNPNASYTGIDFGLLQSAGTMNRNENGALTSLGSTVVGDVWRVTRTIGTGAVTYYKNGALVSTSSNTSAAALLVDSSFRFAGNQAANVRIFDGGADKTVTWNPTNVTVS